MGGTLQGTRNAIERLQSEGYSISLNVEEAVKKGYGRDARSEKFKDVITTEWAQGSVVEVAFGVNAMHGGVYSYRLCRRPDAPRDLTEECFQAGALPFHGSQQWYQFGANASHRRPLTAKRWKDPSNGAEWTRLPIPSCSNHAGFVCDGPMFDPPYGIYGYGGENMDGFQANVVDALKLPDDLPTGDYVLSFRYDVEDGGQVWAQCANVAIKPSSQELAQFVQPPLPKQIQQLTRFRKGGPLTQAHCESWCAADDNCLALEMSGCHEGQACRGSCYHYYTLNLDQAVSHSDPYYAEIGADKERLKRFIKKGSGVFVPAASSGANPQGTNPEGTNPEGTNPHGTNPQGTNHQGTNPQDNNPQGTNPQSTNPQGTNPQGTSQHSDDSLQQTSPTSSVTFLSTPRVPSPATTSQVHPFGSDSSYQTSSSIGSFGHIMASFVVAVFPLYL
jgi:hypothetical protein